MIHQLLFVQGGGADTHDAWDHKLVDSLQAALGPRYEMRYPRMPAEANPEYAAWKATLRQEFNSLREGAILIGHSIGGTLLLHTLAELQPAQVFGAIILLAPPFVGEGGWPSDELPSAPDFANTLPRDVPLMLYHGLADATVPPAHAMLWAHAIPTARIHRLPGRDHQFNEDLSDVAATIRALVPPT